MPAKPDKYAPVGALRHTIGCCGLKEYYGINNANWTPEGWFGLLRSELTDYQRLRFGVMVLVHRRPKGLGRGSVAENNPEWTPTLQSRRLNALRDFIKKHNLGSLTICKESYNPNSGNFLRSATFIPNVEAIKALHKRLITNERRRVKFTPPRAA